MYYRYMYVCFPKKGTERFLSCPEAERVSLSYFEEMAFLYYETAEKELAPEKLLAGELRPFPDGKCFFPMPDIFHYSAPVEKDQWEREIPYKMPWVRINRLKPEMISRYIYFHYQYQEERPGGGPDRYGVVFLFQNYIVHYLELPFEEEKSPLPGALSTHASPADDVDVWDSIMSQFFLSWEGYPFEWHEMKTLTPEGREYLLPANYDKLPQKEQDEIYWGSQNPGEGR